MNVLREHPTIESIFMPWAFELGAAHDAYKGHVYRQFNFCRALVAPSARDVYGTAEAIDERIAIAAAFHDVGVWLSRTMDYLEPSRLRMELWLQGQGKLEWRPELNAMVEYHHKLTPYRGEHAALAEPFRKADAVDLYFGAIRFGLPREFVREVREAFPQHGFHGILMKELARYGLRHPWRPLPMMRR